MLGLFSPGNSAYYTTGQNIHNLIQLVEIKSKTKDSYMRT
jgi:hypothetical protein